MKDNSFEDNVLAEGKPDMVTLKGLEKLLALAEELQDKCDQADTNVNLSRLLEILTVIVITAVAIILGPKPLEWVTHFGVDTALLTLGIGIALWSFEDYIRRIKHRRSRDQRALYKIVGLLRETVGAFAAKEQWSILDKAQFQIRLSRFDIGPSSQTVLKKYLS